MYTGGISGVTPTGDAPVGKTSPIVLGSPDAPRVVQMVAVNFYAVAKRQSGQDPLLTSENLRLYSAEDKVIQSHNPNIPYVKVTPHGIELHFQEGADRTMVNQMWKLAASYADLAKSDRSSTEEIRGTSCRGKLTIPFNQAEAFMRDRCAMEGEVPQKPGQSYLKELILYAHDLKPAQKGKIFLTITEGAASAPIRTAPPAAPSITARPTEGQATPVTQVATRAKIVDLASKPLPVPPKAAQPPTAVTLPTIPNVAEFGLTDNELSTLQRYYTDNRERLEALKAPLHIPMSETGLTRSLVYVPEGPRKGMYVLLKTHGGVEEIGLGSFNRATLTLHLDTGQKKIFRTAKKSDVYDSEIRAYQLTAPHPDHFVAGVPVFYRGPWRSRTGTDREERVKQGPKDYIPREHDVEKVGFIMDYLEGGELHDVIWTIRAGSMERKVALALEYAEHLEVLHTQLGLVHLDQKTENTFMTRDGHIRIADFGMTLKEGEMEMMCGTPGYIAPEVVQAGMETRQFVAYPSADIWSMGCVFADLLSPAWFNSNGQKDERWDQMLDVGALERIKGRCFPQRHIPGSLEHIIDHCLQLNSGDRPAIGDIVAQLRILHRQLGGV